MPRVPFGRWAPDLPPLVNQDGLVECMNCFPKAGGYDPVRELASLSGATAMSAGPRGGGFSGIDGSGAGFLYAGSLTTLEVQRDAGMTDVSRAGGYALGNTDRWNWARHGQYVFAAGGLNGPIQYHLMGSPLVFADLPANAPRARHVATIGNFLVAGNIYDPFDGPLAEYISWSGINQPLLWPEVGSDDARQVQADRQPMDGLGWVMDIVSGAEIGVCFQEQAIHRFDYRGPSTVFERNQVEEGHGMFIPGSAVAFGRLIFYISQTGFRLFDYNGSKEIGKDRVDARFLAELDSQYIDRVETGLDPTKNLIWIIYPGAGNTSGRPNRIIWWDYVLDQYSQGDLECEGLIHQATRTPPSIDAPASAGDPDDVDDPSGEQSFDDRPTTFGSSAMGAFSTTFVASDFSGDLRDGLLQFGDREGSPGRLHWLDYARALVDGKQPTISVSEAFVRDEEPVFGDEIEQELNGTYSIESEARYHQLRVHLKAGWQNAVGIDLLGKDAGEL